VAMRIPNVDVLRLTRRIFRGKLHVLTGSGAPTDAVTGAGTADPSDLYKDTTPGYVYMNTGTKASPIWQRITNTTV
jgi:hypothetical protein